MKALKLGDKNEDVSRLQTFLRGQGYPVMVTGYFGDYTLLYLKKFQSYLKVKETGIFDGLTMMKAYSMGLTDDYVIETDFTVPPKDSYLTIPERNSLYGLIEFRSNPSKDNPEKIVITNDFLDNIIPVEIVGLEHLGITKILWNKNRKKEVQEFFKELKDEGLNKYIISWGGSFNARFIRGSRSVLSSHSWGTAFDINVIYNPLGAMPAKEVSKGSVYKIVNTAHKHGFYWGGLFKNRPDGMHFELVI